MPANSYGVADKSDDSRHFLTHFDSLPKEEIWDEPIWNEKVQIDGQLASVWVDYAFFLGDRFLHCGGDAFHLAKLEETGRSFTL